VVFTANHVTDTDKQNRIIHKLNTSSKKQTTQNTAQQNYHGSVSSYKMDERTLRSVKRM